MDLEFLKLLIISILIGFSIGLERSIRFNSKNINSFAGSRTFALISLAGFLSAYLNEKYPYFLYLSILIIGILIISAYFLKVIHYKKQGSTTHFAAIVTFFLGILTYIGKVEYAIYIGVITIVILSLKPKLEEFESKISVNDINAGVLLLVMTFLILPILPNKTIDPYHLFNPYKTWLMAVLISALSFIGYISLKLMGNKGILITAMAGGLFSSTAVTFTLSKMYKENKNNKYLYIAGISIANAIMFARIYVETLIVNKELSSIILLPFLLATLFGMIYAYYIYKKSTVQKINIDLKSKNPLEIDEAVKFAIIFAIIYAAAELVSNKYGNLGIYLLSFFSGITDVDAITLSLSSLATSKIPQISAINGIIIASVTNSIVKFLIAAIVAKDLSKELFLFFLLCFTGLGIGYLIAI
ncbi:conserved hypothetical protein [Lebetimonas natsushimae]|uniref:Uncharacterized protein n=1 Tax=Lebetimonas natsushimae TaxID=1936991 RepID=A0A292YC23_9BACT|nr:MgtC/SapB family protein [Lebetimonas natsushimae]GAX87308.1 conserved hypothetical protein [Lebetimonas natsushimae]